MLKRWGARPRGIRWLVGIAAVVLAVAVVWVLFVPASDWLAHHDVGSVKGSLHETAVDNARGRLLTLGAGLFAAGALAFTALNFNLLRRNSEQADQWQRRTHELTEEGQVTDRYTKAIEQLGSDKLEVRMGGIYALERVAHDSARDHSTIMDVLSAFVREHSRKWWPPIEPDIEPDVAEPKRSTRPDVQAALTVLGRQDPKGGCRSIDLSRANLTRADLRGAKFFIADLNFANLTGADLRGADLRSANLSGATFDSAYLTDADLAVATLIAADLSGADLTRANLSGAQLFHAVFILADLTDADFTGADFTDAVWPEDTPVPEGWKLDDASDRLTRTGTDSGPAEGS